MPTSSFRHRILLVLAVCFPVLPAAAQDADLEIGKAVFLELSEPPCAICHILMDAEAVGDIGPNLDELKADAERIEAAVANGIGVMPAYGEVLTKEQIEAVALYVVSATTK